MAGFLLDTNILIEAIRNQRERRALLRRLIAEGHTLGCSVITVAELAAGMRSHEQAITSALLDGLIQYELTGEIAWRAGAMKNEWAAKGHTLPLDDLFVAATALVHNLTLVTANPRDFPMPELQIRGF